MIKVVRVSYLFEDNDINEFKKFLNEQGLSLRQFAKICGVSVQYLSGIINFGMPVSQRVLDTMIEKGFKVNL